MSPIQQAFEEGYTEEQILNFLKTAYPQLNKKISSAVSAGHSIKNILNFISPLMQKQTPLKGNSQYEVHAQRRKQDIEGGERLLKTGIQAATALGGGLIAGRALQNVAPQISGLLSKRGVPRTPGPASKTQAAPIMEQNQMVLPQSPSQGVGLSPNQPTPFPPIPKGNAKELVDQLGFTQTIDNLVNKGSPVEDIGPIIKTIMKPHQAKWLKSQTAQPIEEIVNEYIQTVPQSKQENPQENPEQATPSPQHALLPDGKIGRMVGEKQGIAEIELPDGQIRRRKLDELIQEPEEAAVTALELIKSFTPEDERSAHHAVSFYDPSDKEAFFLFHSGDAYKIEDITPEEYKNLSQEVIGAKTAGETLRGQWSVGPGSRGAAYNQIVKAGNKPYRKLQVGYDFFREFQKRINEAQKKSKRKRIQ